MGYFYNSYYFIFLANAYHFLVDSHSCRVGPFTREELAELNDDRAA